MHVKFQDTQKKFLKLFKEEKKQLVMQRALLREEVLTGFAHVPRSSIPLMTRMSRNIKASHEEIAVCVAQLTKDGLLHKCLRPHRLPPVYHLTDNALTLLRQEEYVIVRELSPYEQSSLDTAIEDEKKFAQDQEKVMQFLSKRSAQGQAFTYVLAVQDLLRSCTAEDNMFYTQRVLAQLAWNKEVEGCFDQLLWRFLRVATTHVWD